MQSELTLYTNHGTPFGRITQAFLDITKTPYIVKIVEVMKGEGKTPEYLQISPLGKIPAIQESDGFCLGESVAIMKYIANTRQIDDHWYPKDAKKRAQIDAYLDFHTGNARDFGLTYLMVEAGGNKTKTIEEATKEVDQALEKVIKSFRKDKKFVVSDDKPTIADVATGHLLNIFLAMTKGYQASTEIKAYVEEVNKAIPELEKHRNENVEAISKFIIAWKEAQKAKEQQEQQQQQQSQ